MTRTKISTYHKSKRKRVFDLIIAYLVISLGLPLWIFLYTLIFFVDKKPPIFKQLRTGKNKNPFILYKFRTMKHGSPIIQEKLQTINEAPYPLFKIKEDPRFTSLGSYLSKLGIDEIPQLINIIRGEMSIVGPRPLPIDEANLLDSTWDFRYQVRPGILSKWALSLNKHKSVKHWKTLEKEGLKKGSISNDIKLIIGYIFKILIKSILLNR